MPLTIPCPNCRIVLTYGEPLAGKQVRCPQCKTVVTTPLAPPVAAAPPRPATAPAPPAPKAAPVPPPPALPVAAKPEGAAPRPAQQTSTVPTLEAADDDLVDLPPKAGRTARAPDRPAADDRRSPVQSRYLGWGTAGLAMGVGLILAIIVGTALIQIMAVGASDSELSVIGWLKFSTGEWSLSAVNNANYARYFANFLIVVLMLALLLSLAGCYLATPSWRLRLLPVVAGVCLVPAVILAVALPTVVWLADRFFNPAEEGMYETHAGLIGRAFALCLGSAYGLCLVGAVCHLLFLRGMVRSVGQPKLGAGMLWLIAALVVGSAMILLPALLASPVVKVLTKDPDGQSLLTGLATLALFLFWVLFAVVCYVWLLVLHRRVNMAVRAASGRP